jgi:hypothetical protein
MSARRLLAAIGAALPLAVATAIGCVSPNADDRLSIEAPARDDFAPVGTFLIHRCGSLDCHGATGRNLRLYGREAARLDAMDVPGSGPTTMAELDADYRSVVALEPEVMSDVLKDHGQNSERLLLIAKPLGLEHHKGGTLMTPHDAQEGCITSWIAGKTDATACASALKVQ